MKPRVIIVYNDCRYVYKFKKNLIKAIQSEGYGVSVIAPYDRYANKLRLLGVDFLSLDIGGRELNPFHHAMILWRLRRRLKAAQPAAILLFGAKPNILGGVAAIGLNGKTIHNITGLGTTFLRSGSQKAFMLLLYRCAMRFSDTIFFQNFEDKNLFVENRAVIASKVKVIPGSGVDLERYAGFELRKPRVNRVTFIGRLLLDKGIVEFLDAANSLSLKYPDVIFTVLGGIDSSVNVGVSEYELDSKTQASNIEYLGEVEDVRPIIANSICVVLPSYREGLPRVLLESLAMKVPVIATDVPGCRQVVEHGVSGYLCQAKNVGSLQEAMITMLELPSRARDSMGDNGQQHVKRVFDEKLVIDQYLKAIGSGVVRH